MRFVLVLLLVGISSPVHAGDPPALADAALRAVQFVDENEGWACGDDGVILHTIDGGVTWERQETHLRASLQSICFVDPFTGYVAGRETLPHGAGSAGVVLYTRDGGVKWTRISRRELPGLNRVKFVDHRFGFVAGDGSDQFPSGLFATDDGGVNWKPIEGKRCPGWFGADFTDATNGVIVGAWGNLMAVRKTGLIPGEVDGLKGRNVRAVQLIHRFAVAAGDGGLLMTSEDGGQRWGFVDLKLPKNVQDSWDLHALHAVGEHVWITGRPGSVVLHSWDRGTNWQVQNTGQSLPLHGIWFANEKTGWAVGELGTILATIDGGKTWKAQRRGGHKAAVLFITGRSESVPLGGVALLGADEGFLCAAVRVAGPDPASAIPSTAMDGLRLAEAMRFAGGAAGEMLWQFPLPQHLNSGTATDLARHWAGSFDEARGLEELERQIVLAIRTWRPDVVITDNPDPRSSTGQLGAAVALAAGQAFTKAGQGDAFPEQLAKLDLQPWNVNKLYGRWDSGDGSHVQLDLTTVRPYLLGSALDYVQPAQEMMAVAHGLPSVGLETRTHHFRLLASRLDDADKHRTLMQGISLERGGQARRTAVPLPDDDWKRIEKQSQQKRDTQAIAQSFAQDPQKAAQMLAHVENSLKGLPDEQAGEAAYSLGQIYARTGQWLMAKEVFVLMLDRFPKHRLAPEACRWLIQFGSSSEARRREEMNQFMKAGVYRVQKNPKYDATAELANKLIDQPPLALGTKQQNVLLRRQDELKDYFKSSLVVGEMLTAFGPIYANQPDVQFNLQSSNRKLGQVDAAQLWYSQHKLQTGPGPWHDAAGAEMWLQKRAGPSPKPLAHCPPVGKAPYLDGKFDDDCWKDVEPIAMRSAAGADGDKYPTEARLVHDDRFLYVALSCKHPDSGHYVPPVKPRPRDADLRHFDRVSLLLDVDRDYTTCYNLQIDQRGCVFEDCWGDATWNPKWFVAIESNELGWQIEVAIPLAELVSEPVKPSHVWAFNLVRTIPGKGVHAFSLPADATPRPEGMGLLMFNAAETAVPSNTGKAPPKIGKP